MSRKILAMILVLALLFLSSLPARADASTPFIEGANVAVGTVSEGQGWVLTAGARDDGSTFLVLVTTDTMQFITILATAEKGVVPPELLGRLVTIKAEIVERPKVLQANSAAGMKLKILAVRGSNAAAPAEIPAVTQPAGAAIVAPGKTTTLGMPHQGLQVLLQERDATGKSVGKEVTDQITYVDGSITTIGLAMAGIPPVKVAVSPGNATDFYSGTATGKDGAIVTWQWGALQMPQRPQPFEASLTVITKDGKKHLWEVRQSGE